MELANNGTKIFTKLDNLDGIGNKILIDIQNFFECKQNVRTIRTLSAILEIEDYVDNVKPSALSGHNIVFTGSLISISRAEAKAQAERLGANAVGTVSSNTNIVVAGEKAGSKLKKAEELGIPIIDAAGFAKLLATGELPND